MSSPFRAQPNLHFKVLVPQDINKLYALNQGNTKKSVRIVLMLRKGLVIKLKKVPKNPKQVEVPSQIYNFISCGLNVL